MKKTELQQEIQDLVSQFTQKKEVSQKKLAEMIGVSSATLSNIQNNVWERVNDSMLHKIKSFFRAKDWAIVETTNFSTVQNKCDEARNRRTMIGIIGYTGAGKTTALVNYYESHSNTFMVTCTRSMRSKQFLSEILKSMGINYLASDFEMVKYIIEEFNKKEDSLLIIDEASKLSANCLMYIQDMLDGIENNAGIIIAGVEYLLLNIKKGSDKNKIGMPEFYGRVAQWQHLVEPSKLEIKSICMNNGVTDEESIRAMYRLGNFRYVRNSIHNLKYSE
ncbi:ATP-binding protein [Leeuwenhoekiella parthenopeia]|uniref:ATP-binding protein n=1 Tax=Leeuwenhoekiella parthenopeia TaxID=2890320 RepID=A0ABS8GPM6_9FLAO|nr:ATP-binding protein [Leeuwenhoekiella parthenopeia]MCC4211706.1 ATP-binding protein [Leeuwenhoekiella parthenopeia]